MRGIYSWLYVDYRERVWKFFVNENSELYYKIMYKEGKWTKEILIDSRVTSFGLFIDDSEIIHLVYSNKKGDLRYCTLKEKQWLGKILYKVEDKNYEIESIKIEILGSVMHIFFALASRDGSDHGLLMHCIWDGQKINVNKLQDIILKEGLEEYYLIKVNNKNEIYLFYLSDEGDELSLNYSIYKENNWINSIRLYGIKGEEVCFEVEVENDNVHILNKSKEGLTYYLDHVIIDRLNSYESFNVYTGNCNIKAPLIVKEDDKVCACWIEGNNICYSIFNITKWTKVKRVSNDNINNIERYNAYVSDITISNTTEMCVYGTRGFDLCLYYPKDFILNYNKRNNLLKEDNGSNRENIDSLNNELYKLKKQNKVLEDKIVHFNLSFEKNKKVIEGYKEKVIRALEQKRKAEENSNVFLDIQKKIQREYEDLLKDFSSLKEEKKSMEFKLKDEIKTLSKEKLNKEAKIKDEYKIINEKIDNLIKEKINLEGKLKEYVSEIDVLNNKIDILSENIIIKDKENEENKEIIKSLENKNTIIKEENSLIKQELSYLIEENKRINMELEIEKNQSVMERLLRRRN